MSESPIHNPHDKLSPGVEHKIMSLAERLRAEGKLEGKLEGEILIIKKMLVNGVDPKFIAKNTGFPLQKILSIKEKLKRASFQES